MRKFIALAIIVIGIVALYMSQISESGTTGLPKDAEKFDFTAQKKEITEYIRTNFKFSEKKFAKYALGQNDEDFIKLIPNFQELIAYWGEAVNDIPNGKGMLMRITKHGDKYIYSPAYIGTFLNGKPEGFGIQYSASNSNDYKSIDELGGNYSEYEGMFKNGVRNGNGNKYIPAYTLSQDLSDSSKWTSNEDSFSSQQLALSIGTFCNFSSGVQQYMEKYKKEIDGLNERLKNDKLNSHYCNLGPYPAVLSYSLIYKDGQAVNGKAFLNGKLCYVGGLKSASGDLSVLGIIVFYGNGTLYAPDGKKLYSGKWIDGKMSKN